MTIFVIFLFGLTLGSFLNVVICRLPLGQSVLIPPSHCPQCKNRLSWVNLVPLVSYVVQGGKCCNCGKVISLQYPIVEMATGLIYVGLYIIFGLKIKLGVALLFASVLIPLVVIDLQQQIIPDQLNMTGAIAGLLAIVASDITFINALIGAFIGGGLMLLIAVISRGGMGGGDIKMMAWVGLFLGWKLTLLALFLSFLIGGLGSLILILFGIKKRKDFIPFGPFLAIGGFTAYAFGYEILAWYLTRAF